MHPNRWLAIVGFKPKNLHNQLILIFALFFLMPVVGLLVFGIRHRLMTDNSVLSLLLVILVFSFLGFTSLRLLFERISFISRTLSQRGTLNASKDPLPTETDDLAYIEISLETLEEQLQDKLQEFAKKNSQIAGLKELSEIATFTFDPGEMLHVALERCLAFVQSEVGSILLLDPLERKSFVVAANIGLEQFIRKGDRIDLETSIAKYAVINKSPLVVENIEKDKRFGRANRSHYGTKSFACLPIKTCQDVIGVLTLSGEKNAKPLTPEDVETLVPLLNHAALIYENIRLVQTSQRESLFARIISKVSKVINSSVKTSELLNSVLEELRGVIPFERAVALRYGASGSERVTLFDFVARTPLDHSRGTAIAYPGTVIEKVLKNETSLLVEEGSVADDPVARELLMGADGMVCLLIPVKLDGMIKGVLTFAGPSGERFDNGRELLEWIANIFFLALERNGLSDAVVKRKQELDTIRQAGRALASSTFDTRKVLQYTMDLIREVMQVEAGALYLVEGQTLKLGVSFNMEVSQPARACPILFGQGIPGYVAARGEALVVNDMMRSPYSSSDVDEFKGGEVRSALCVPVISQGMVRGVLEVVNKTDGDFSRSDEELLQSIASSMSIAMENARLYRETVSIAEQERSIRRTFQKFVPKEVVEKITHDSETGRALIEESRRLTLLNIDIRGFSSLVRQIGPGKTVKLLNRFFTVMGGCVFKHRGIVDKYLGDGFLAVFGAPVTTTRDAENAVRAALEMQQAVDVINADFINESGTSVDIGISVHTGEVVVGNIGFEMKMDYTVIGDAVNVVFRLQELAKAFPNGILISESTRRAVEKPLEVRETGNFCQAGDVAADLKIYVLSGLKSDSAEAPTAVCR